MTNTKPTFVKRKFFLPTVALFVIMLIPPGGGGIFSKNGNATTHRTAVVYSRKKPFLPRYGLSRPNVGLGAAKASLSSKISLRTSGKSKHRAKKSAGTARSHAVITFAEQVNKIPDFIFPIQGPRVFNTTNYQQFDYLMYRPLYWFSNAAKPTLNERLSLAYPPVFSSGDRVVTIKMKMWSWSNGEKVNAEDVAFWLNLVKIEGPQHRFAPYSATGIPADVSGVTIVSPSVIRLTLYVPTNPSIFTDDELSQIVPLPAAWDVDDQNEPPGQGGCASAGFSSVTLNAQNLPSSAGADACEAVYEFLAQQSGYEPMANRYERSAYLSFASDPIWQVVDGPWRLSAMMPPGEAVFRPNNRYSGPVQAKVSEFVEIPFTSYDNELVALSLGQLSLGYLVLPPPVYNSGSSGTGTTTTVTVPVTSSSGQVVSNLSNSVILSEVHAGYRQIVNYDNNVDFAVYNFDQNGSLSGKLLRLPYVRKALQYLIDQNAIVKNVYGGFAKPTYNLIPGYNLVYGTPKYRDLPLYVYNQSKAVGILVSHGWKINKGGVDVCMAKAGCGTSVPQGTQLQLQIEYLSGDMTIQDELELEAKSFAAAGIEMGLTPLSAGQLLANLGGCTLRETSCDFSVAYFGGWSYALSYAPTAKSLLDAGSSANASNFTNPNYQSLLSSLLSGTDSAAAKQYLSFLGNDLPVLYEPTPAEDLVQAKKDLTGFIGFGPSGAITPENWAFGKSGKK